MILAVLSLATLAAAQPYGYQYQLPKEYNSHQERYQAREPWMRFLQKYISQESTPYRYQSHPMANVPVSNIGFDDMRPSQYKAAEGVLKDRYMLGEVFFKDNDQHQDEGYNEEELPYRVLERYETYEKRLYPSAHFVCNTTSVDTAADSLAGLERMNPFEVMMSRRYQKTPRTQQFMELFRYISGVNQNQEEIEMTRPVVVFHNITKETSLGNYENQTMCFYLPKKYQEHDEDGENHQQTKPAPRHAAATPPTPINDRVFILTRPRMEVFVRRFGGFALTHDSWEKQKEILEEDIIGQKYNPSEYFTASYNNPWQLANRRNEVWLQSFQAFQTLPAGQHDNKGRTSGHHNQRGGQQKPQQKFQRAQKNPGNQKRS